MSEKLQVINGIKIKFLALLFVSLSLLEAAADPVPFLLKEQLLSGASGDYIVLAKGRSFSCLSLQKISPKKVFVEEIFFPHLPKTLNPKLLTSANKESLTKQFPNTRTLLTLSEDNLSAVEGEGAEINMICFLNTLLGLTFSPISDHSTSEENSFLPLTIEGEQDPKVPVTIFESLWPEDHSLLSGKKILIYLTDPKISPFPTRIVIDSPRGRITIRCVSLGKRN
ncbi:hypothetical protein [Chlamydiifrater volucris]